MTPKKQLVYCVDCGYQMEFIYDRRLRDTCWDCGGEAKDCRPEPIEESKGL